MKNRFFIAIALLTAVFFFGCDLGLASDPTVKAALSDPTVTQTADTEIPVEFSDGIEIPVEFTGGYEIPVEFAE